MATHRAHDTGFAPEFDFQLTLAVLEASERFGARRRPITSSLPVPTISQIEAALCRIDGWRQHVLTCDLLGHCRQLVALRDRVEAEQCRLAEDWVYLNRMLQEAQALLENTVPPVGRAPAGAKEARPLQ
jgi:hypothetical protein